MKKGFSVQLFSLILVLGGMPGVSHADRSDLAISSSNSADSILRFSEVVAGLFRGARPEYQGVIELSSKGIKTIINLENESRYADPEKKQADKLGMTTFSSPMNAYRRPNDAQVNSILKVMQDPSAFPIFIHCHHGQDRTGLMVGLYRVEVQKWSPEAAYKEMLSIGFHPDLKELDQYFRDRTGYRGP